MAGGIGLDRGSSSGLSPVLLEVIGANLEKRAAAYGIPPEKILEIAGVSENANDFIENLETARKKASGTINLPALVASTNTTV